MAQMLSFTVYGKPQGQGSTRAFMPKGARYPIITSTNKNLKPWRQEVAATALSVMRETGFKMIESGPVKMEAVFHFACPKSKKKSMGKYKDTSTDADKLVRGLADSLSKVAYRDDAQIAHVVASKFYSEQDSTQVIITAL